MNPYHQFVCEFAELHRRGKSLPLGGIAPVQHAAPKAGAPVALIFSPHPDDECIIGGLALRLMREAGVRVINIAVTLGSNKARQPGRWQELSNACGWIGFGLEAAGASGLEKVNPQTRAQAPEQWKASVAAIAALLKHHQPRIVFLPHAADVNSTHVGTHLLVRDALAAMPGLECFLVETEFWGQMASPNLMVELSAENVSEMLAALSFHVGEVERNPYHLGLPAWMRDNVRLGAELVGGQGGAAPDYLFATLYRVSQWKNGAVQEAWAGGKQLRAADSPASIFGL